MQRRRGSVEVQVRYLPLQISRYVVARCQVSGILPDLSTASSSRTRLERPPWPVQRPRARVLAASRMFKTWELPPESLALGIAAPAGRATLIGISTHRFGPDQHFYVGPAGGSPYRRPSHPRTCAVLPGWLGSSDSEPPGVTANTTPGLVFWGHHSSNFVASCWNPTQTDDVASMPSPGIGARSALVLFRWTRILLARPGRHSCPRCACLRSIRSRCRRSLDNEVALGCARLDGSCSQPEGHLDGPRSGLVALIVVGRGPGAAD